MLMCLRPFCQWSKGCAADAEAKCRVNPCKMCAVEYFDEENKLIDCDKGIFTRNNNITGCIGLCFLLYKICTLLNMYNVSRSPVSVFNIGSK